MSRQSRGGPLIDRFKVIVFSKIHNTESGSVVIVGGQHVDISLIL